jgi:hypothetical protein
MSHGSPALNRLRDPMVADQYDCMTNDPRKTNDKIQALLEHSSPQSRNHQPTCQSVSESDEGSVIHRGTIDQVPILIATAIKTVIETGR